MTTNLAMSFNAWLRDERHHFICSFLIEHYKKVKINIAKGEVYTVSPFSEFIFGVFIGTSILNVDIKEHNCTCRA